jgi:protein ImuB
VQNADRLNETVETQSEQADDSQLASPVSSTPLLLWRDDSRRGRTVVAGCGVCQSHGVRPNQPLYEATDLLGKALGRSSATSEAFQVFRHDPQADVDALAKIATILQYHISPLVAIEPEATFAGLPSAQPQTLLLDITGIGDWFGDERAVLVEAERVLGSQGLRGRLAITDTSAAAWAFAHFKVPRGAASDSLLLPPDEMFPVAGELTSRALRLDTETAHQLDRLGLNRIADVMELPRDGLAARLGSDLLRRIDEFTGLTPQTLTMHHPAVEESAVCTLEYPTSDQPIIEHRLRLLIDRIATNLAARRRGALRLSCQFEMTQHPKETLAIGLFVPTADAEHLTRLVISSLERHRLPSMVQRITLSVTLGGPLQQYQQTMFGDDSISQVATRRSLARLIETLAGRLGRQAVVGIESSRNPLPESAFKQRPLAGETRSTLYLGKQNSSRLKSKSAAANSSFKSPRQSAMEPALGPQSTDAMRRPLRLFSTPQTLEIIELGSDLTPHRIRIGNRIHQVIRYWGPERIETGWWDGPQVRRDYYRIELDDGSWWWIYHQLQSSPTAIWKLHGQFT